MTSARPGRWRPDLRERIVRRLFRLVNPLAHRMITAGRRTGAPNILLSVRGRGSGIERSTPVTLLDLDGRWYVKATYGAAGWCRNLRAAGEAIVIQPGGRRDPVHAIEVPPDEAAAMLRRVLEPYRQAHLLRKLLGLHSSNVVLTLLLGAGSALVAYVRRQQFKRLAATIRLTLAWREAARSRT